MYINQENIIVSDVRIACRVFPGMGTMVHKDRPSDGFVINDGKSVKYYYFSDGTVLKTHENEFFYLPKRSSYEVKEINDHGVRETRRVASVNNALCQGCGACTVACPSGAMDLQGFSNLQIIAEVDAICR